MNVFRRNSDRALIKGATMLVTVLMLAVINVWPLLDLGYDASTATHVEEPDGSPAHQGAAHDHALCGVMSSAHVLPGTVQSVGVSHSDQADNAHLIRDVTDASFTFTVHHSRAPPSS